MATHLLQATFSRRFPLTSWPWRALAYATTTVPVAAFVAVPLAILALPWFVAIDRLRDGMSWPIDDVFLLVVVGIVTLGVFGPLVAHPLATLERRRLKIIDGRAQTYRRRGVYRDPRALIYTIVLVTGVPVAYGLAALLPFLALAWLTGAVMLSVDHQPITLGFGTVTTVWQSIPYALAAILLVAALPWLLGILAGAHGAFARALLAEDEVRVGLDAAIRDLAETHAIPVTVVADTGRRLPDRIEATAYSVVAEALTNVTRHSGASTARVSVVRDASTLAIEVVDDGRGGADPAGGTGLTGLADRVAAVGGRFLMWSPHGGPTVVRAELPCR